MMLSAQIAAVVAAYIEAEPAKVTAVSSRAFGESKLLPRFFDGQSSMTIERAERGLQWFSDHWPPSAVWPEGVVRPPPSSQSAGAPPSPVTPAPVGPESAGAGEPVNEVA